MRTLKESPKRDKIKPLKDPILKQQIAKLVQRTRLDKPSTLPFFQQSKLSSKAFGAVRSFAANTNVGTVRKANEDRIAIILNVIQPQAKHPKVAEWPKIQIFGVFDGHGGHKCAEYLKDNLHNNIVLQPEFPHNIPLAIKNGSIKTEQEFFKAVAFQNGQCVNKSGSCAILIFVVNESVYLINVGDSRAICSESCQDGQTLVSQVK